MFTGDELIEAYLQGCKEGIDQYKKVLLNKLSENISLAQKLGSVFIGRLNGNGIVCSGAHLKYMDIERYKIIFVLNPDVYYNFDAMAPIYEMAYSFEAEKSAEDFFIEIAFLPKVDSINQNRLVSDGFIFEYNG